MISNYKRLGDYIQIVNIRNNDLQVTKLLGVSIQKILMPSIANTVGTNMKTYKIIKKNQFAYGPVTSRNGDKISIALLHDFDKAIISQAYTVFEIIDTDKLNPEYLMMWFRRPEFDRYARFKSHGSARETFDWDEMCEVELPIPSIEKQNEIVKEYNIIVNRIKLNEQLNQKLEETAQAIYKHWFIDFNFPITKESCPDLVSESPDLEGKPYKSSGGKMVWDEVLEKDIPEGWSDGKIEEFGDIITGKTPSIKTPEQFGRDVDFVTPTDFKNYNKFVYGAIRGISEIGKSFFKNKLLPKNSVLVTCIGSDMGKVVINKELCLTNQQINSIVTKQSYYSDFLYYHLQYIYEYLRNIATGSSTMLMINKSDFEKINILKPDDNCLFQFSKKIEAINQFLYKNIKEQKELFTLKKLLLSKMSKI